MAGVIAPAAVRPVLRRPGRGAAALLLLLAAGCGALDAPARTAHAAERPEAPAADPLSPVDAACDVAVWMVDEALGVEAERAEAPLSDLLRDTPASGCRLVAAGSFADLPDDVETPVDLLWERFGDGGWHEDPRFASDTEGTSAVGMWRSGVLCVMGAMWVPVDSWAEDREPTEDELRYDVMLECAPAEAPPIRPTGRMT